MTDPTGTGGRRRGRTRARLLLALLAAALLIVLAEGATDLLLAWRDSSDALLREELHARYDPDLGWSHVPGASFPDLYGPGRTLTVDARGFRGTEEPTPGPPAGRYRIACLGDSFTLGYGVGDADTFPAWLERLNPRVQALNMGQGGYGVDQCYLWYLRDGADLAADLVVLAYIAPDWERMLTDRFEGRYPKPVLVEEEGALVAAHVPVPDEWHAHPLAERLTRFAEGTALSEALRRLRRTTHPRLPAPADEPLAFAELGERLVDELARLCGLRGSRLCVVQIPLRDPLAGRPARVAEWMQGVARRLDVPFLDLSADLQSGSPGEFEAHYLPDGHLNELGNRRVAELLLRRLGELGLGLPEAP